MRRDPEGLLVAMASSIPSPSLNHKAKDWWEELNRSKSWQDGVFYALAALYAAIAIVALVQLIRIHRRVRDYGWTTQKVFHLLNFLVCAVRASVFLFRRPAQHVGPHILQSFLLDLPGLLFFSTYTLLVLFWAEIFYQALSLPTENLRPSFLIINTAIYVFQIAIWLIQWWDPMLVWDIFSRVFFAGVSFAGALGFLLYGGRLFLMLRRFPIESKGRRKKLREVGCVTAICFTCFTIRSVVVAWSAFDKKAEIDVLYHPILNFLYFLLVEILPSALVLYILRKLPAKRATSTAYKAIR
ncbi:hypothetical protein SELMODRAFT_177501 [Selaginella moellendorffii]|uniref:THH1/TOM1/TOM3 domain-containing protein n=1 Tax=Selaginella moellendorffii TaxID=88036 RepID=D8S755_SELML|nr:tobamovirus multiplication protein 3 [Selaginella moellendorffii]EFJ19552.1 hypothetical protein SELMODRAFT_177501 [Selaginella moellendorffii]|eukprot:XP_002979144.1 tobamovirus multiplication protein 3 [Selaginella moellendorffii]